MFSIFYILSMISGTVFLFFEIPIYLLTSYVYCFDKVYMENGIYYLALIWTKHKYRCCNEITFFFSPFERVFMK